MRLSTRSRYGVRLMLELAMSYGKGQVLLKDIARLEDISEKYLSIIIIPLRSAGLVQSTRGAKGGYVLAKSPSEITLKEIVSVLEGDICLVDCVKNQSTCPRADTCASRDIWAMVSDQISSALGSTTLEDLVRKSRDKSGKATMYHI